MHQWAKSAKKYALFSLFTLAVLMGISATKDKKNNVNIPPMVVQGFLKKVKDNTSWKVAFATGVSEQIVFMSVSSTTSPHNEIGMKTHLFDQAILIVEGRGEVILNGTSQSFSANDLIFVPKGTAYNIINGDPKKALKLVSFSSAKDIPAGAVYETKMDEQ